MDSAEWKYAYAHWYRPPRKSSVTIEEEENDGKAAQPAAANAAAPGTSVVPDTFFQLHKHIPATPGGLQFKSRRRSRSSNRDSYTTTKTDRTALCYAALAAVCFLSAVLIWIASSSYASHLRIAQEDSKKNCDNHTACKALKVEPTDAAFEATTKACQQFRMQCHEQPAVSALKAWFRLEIVQQIRDNASLLWIIGIISSANGTAVISLIMTLLSASGYKFCRKYEKQRAFTRTTDDLQGGVYDRA